MFPTAGLAGLALALPLAGPGHAQCVQTGTIVTCAADDPDGFASSDDGLTIDVLPDITVENATGDAFDLDGTDDQTVANAGTIFSENDRGIDVDDGDGLTVTNGGVVDALDDAIRGGNDLTVTNGFDGEIVSLDQEGIDAGDGARLTVTNEGLIEAGDEGIQAGLDATITNGVDGGILAVDDAIQVEGDADIVNSGIILSLDEDGIDVDSGRVENTLDGVIASFGLGAAGIDVDAPVAVDGVLPTTFDLLIENAGSIAGDIGVLVDPTNTASQTVLNSGLIGGGSGIAIDLGAGEDVLSMVGEAVVEGATLFGAGDDLLDLSAALPVDAEAVIGGRASFFDGGAQDIADVIALGAGVTLDDILVLSAANPERMRLRYVTAGGASDVFFTDFELVEFGGRSFTVDRLAELKPVPLPAGAGLLLAGTGLLWALRRRRPRPAGGQGTAEATPWRASHAA